MKRKKKISGGMIAASLLTMLTIISAFGKSSANRQAESDARKADYIFLEAQRYRALDNTPAYLELIEAAYDLNPSDPYIAKEYGLKLIVTAAGDSLRVEEGIVLMGNYVKQHPEDNNTGMLYSQMLNQMGRNREALDVAAELYDASTDRSVVGAYYASMLSYTGIDSNLQRAIEVIKDIENAEGGTNINTTMRKMQYNLMRGDTAAVLDEGRALVASSPRSVEYLSLMGTVYQQFGYADSALMMFNRAIEADPTNGIGYISRADYYMAIGDSVGYDKEVFHALAMPELDYEPKLNLLRDYVVKLYEDSTQHERIGEMFASLIDQFPHESDLRLLYCDYLIQIGQLAPAAEQLSYALDTDPDDVRRWNMLGALYFSTGQEDNVVPTIEAALRYFPDNVSLYQMGATAESQQGNYDRAFKYLERAEAVVDSTDVEQLSEIVGSIGDIYYASGQPDSSIVYYEKALKLNPENLLVMNNCAYHLAVEGRDLDRALALIEHVVAQKPDDATSLDTYAWVLFKRKDYAKAREVIDAVLESDNEGASAEIFEHAGDIYFMDARPDEAVDFWKKALELDPDNQLLRKKVSNQAYYFK